MAIGYPPALDTIHYIIDRIIFLIGRCDRDLIETLSGRLVDL